MADSSILMNEKPSKASLPPMLEEGEIAEQQELSNSVREVTLYDSSSEIRSVASSEGEEEGELNTYVSQTKQINDMLADDEVS